MIVLIQDRTDKIAAFLKIGPGSLFLKADP